MKLSRPIFSGRKIERSFLLLGTIVFSVLFFQLYHVLQKDFGEVEERLAKGSIVNLNHPNAAAQLKVLLKNGYYLNDNRDIDLICSSFDRTKKTTDGEIDNIGELNKNRFAVQATVAEKNGGDVFQKRVRLQRELLGFSDNDSALFFTEMVKPLKVSSANNLHMGNGMISGTIRSKDNLPLSGVLVRLQMLFLQDSLYNSDSDIQNTFSQTINGIRKEYFKDVKGNVHLQSLTAFTRTDINGKYAFTGLRYNAPYTIIPLQPGYRFGQLKTIDNFQQNNEANFIQSVNTIKLFATKDFNILKKEKSLVVRTPQDATAWYWIIVVCFVVTFWVMHFFLRTKLPDADQFILPVIMFLTGLSFLTLFSLQDPLRDRFFAKSTFFYFEGGMLLIFIILLFNLRFFTADSALYRLFIVRKLKSTSNGWQWALIAALLLFLTTVFGKGPEGSGVKINLFGFQPSELVKYLIIIFLAGFFSVNERFISGYTTLRKRAAYFIFALIAITLNVLLFLILGDLGPAMVCCFTFIVLFSFSRGDFGDMILFIVLYVLSIWIMGSVWVATFATAAIMILYMLFYKKQLRESAVMSIILIAVFLLLDQFTILNKYIPGPVHRLTERKAIWQNPWDNEVYGGDQVANGLWAMAGGGITGQGTGEGFAKVIPEAHTDMILPAIGEEFGMLGILSVFVLFVLFMHRAIIIGRQTGTPFLFFLCAGIGISTFIQFVLIAGGSTGALPLSGVALPFISYGGSSLLANMIGAGIVLSTSHIRGTNTQMRFITAQQDKNLLPALSAAFIGVVLLAINVSGYFINNKKWVVEPALVADRSGNRMFSYNPRINILMNRLQAGDLLDRNGLVLATSNVNNIKQQKDSLVAIGIRKEDLDNFNYKRADRYYPFGAHTFFWTGDANTGIFNGSYNGYFAEYEHAAELRGFPTPVTKFQTTGHHLKKDETSAPEEFEMTVSKRDYSELASLLLQGINSEAVINFRQKNRNVQMTIDAALQTSINLALATDDSVKIKRASVVVMESNTGDVLASCMYPLPAVNDYEKLTLSDAELNRIPGWNVNSDIGFTYTSQPGSTAKLITALAAFNKLGESAATLTKHIYPKDLIRVKGLEPDEAGDINIERAIVKSNNSFFIRLANEERLEEEMGNLYLKTGMFLHGAGGYFYKNDQNLVQQNKWRELWRNTEYKSITTYNPNNIKRTRGKGVSGMSWGQGELKATPASVARVAMGIANNGLLLQNRYVLTVGGKPTIIQPGIQLVNNVQAAMHLKDYMIKQSAGKAEKLKLNVAGKTGTPERIWKGQKINDGWYVFFAPKAIGTGYIVVCVRLEAAKGSSEAVRLAGSYVIPQLIKNGYIKSFDARPNARPLSIDTGTTDSLFNVIDSL